ncbi:MAG: hypothetical protein NTW87_35095 [Planctomycetota bacterium]|nr:hypothetical protein [Planctomycetota bacterium]
MKYNLIVVEGPDDLAAIRELFQRRYGPVKTEGVHVAPGQPRTARFAWSDVETQVMVAMDKRRVAVRVKEQMQAIPTSDRPYCQIGVCFDPDEHDDGTVHAWLREECGVPDATPGDGVYRATCGNAKVDIVPLPWDLGPMFDELKDFRNLERVALAVLAKTDAGEGKLIEELLEKVRSANKNISWKTAFRLWAAIRYADCDPGAGGAMAQVFGQDEQARQALETVLKDSPFLVRLRRFAGSPPPCAQ